MSGGLRLATIVMLGSGGLFTGGVVWYAWERIWIWRRLGLTEYAVDFRRSLRKADPALPILLVICACAAAAFAWQTSGAGRILATAGIVPLAIILVSSIVLAEPINNQFRRRPEGVAPPGAERLRLIWRRFHLIRTALAVVAFAFIVTAVTYP